MRRAGFAILALLVTGCAASHAPRAVITYTDTAPQKPAAAAALVFDPPVTAYTPPLDLARDGREPVAYLGYDEGTTTFYYVRQDDRQADYGRFRNGNSHFPGFDSTFERRAVSETTGVRYR